MSGYNDGPAITLYDALGNQITNGQLGSDAISQNNRGLDIRDFQYQFNETTWDRVRGTTAGTLLASGVRSTGATTPAQVNYNHRGLILYLNVTVNPGGAQTLTVTLRARTALVGAFGNIMVSGAQAFGGAAGTYVGIIYPGPGAPTAWTGITVTNNAETNLPRNWDVNILPSGGGNWTYSLEFDLLL